MRYIMSVFLIVISINVFSQKTTGALHCLGNGQYCAFERGADVTSLFGPSYSSPSYLKLNFKDKEISSLSVRETGTAIWKHTIMQNGEKVAEITDFVDGELPVFVRKVNTYKSFIIDLNILKDTRLMAYENTSEYKGNFETALLIHKGRGLPIMSEYTHPYEQFQQLILKGTASLQKNESAEIYEIRLNPGQSEIYFVGGPFYKECVENSKKIIDTNYNKLYERTIDYWHEYTSRRENFDAVLPSSLPNRQQILDQIDNVAVLLKTQHSNEGGEIAGDFYHMAYIRDQYGVSRGFLALGYYQEAKEILNFYWNIWQRFGVLHNAQAIGIPGIFHIHENDEVEQTGYLIIQAFDYLKKTNDVDFVKMIMPMLKWAWDVQKRNLIRYMLPFNGDETYVAGGILPRTALNDGSAESTLLFLQGGQLLLPFVTRNKLWNKDSIRIDEKLRQDVAGHYAENFIQDGKIITNNPKRMSIEEMPAFRHGVCTSGTWHGVVYTQKDKSGNYLCPKCYAEKKIYSPIERKTYYLPSIALTPVFIGSAIVSNDVLQHNLELVKNNYLKTGQVSSRTDNNTVIGYEYGFFLYSLVKKGDPLADKVFADAMSAVDESGAWVEYYKDGNPKGCRYRPWESAINIEAIIEYAKSKK